MGKWKETKVILSGEETREDVEARLVGLAKAGAVGLSVDIKDPTVWRVAWGGPEGLKTLADCDLPTMCDEIFGMLTSKPVASYPPIYLVGKNW